MYNYFDGLADVRSQFVLDNPIINEPQYLFDWEEEITIQVQTTEQCEILHQNSFLMETISYFTNFYFRKEKEFEDKFVLLGPILKIYRESKLTVEMSIRYLKKDKAIEIVKKLNTHKWDEDNEKKTRI